MVILKVYILIHWKYVNWMVLCWLLVWRSIKKLVPNRSKVGNDSKSGPIERTPIELNQFNFIDKCWSFNLFRNVKSIRSSKLLILAGDPNTWGLCGVNCKFTFIFFENAWKFSKSFFQKSHFYLILFKYLSTTSHNESQIIVHFGNIISGIQIPIIWT